MRVEDEAFAGAKYVGSDPPAGTHGERLAWPSARADAGAEKRIAVRVKPSEETPHEPRDGHLLRRRGSTNEGHAASASPSRSPVPKSASPATRRSSRSR